MKGCVYMKITGITKNGANFTLRIERDNDYVTAYCHEFGEPFAIGLGKYETSTPTAFDGMYRLAMSVYGEDKADDMFSRYNNDLLMLEKKLSDKFLFQPVFMYNHGDIALDTVSFIGRAFHADWDSCRIGFIAVSKEHIRETENVKNISPKMRKKWYDIMRDKIKTLNNIINYNVWGYTLEYEGDTGEDDSWWGFVGDDWANSGLTDNLPAEVLESEALLKAIEEDRYSV